MNAICVYITAARIVMQTDTADTCSIKNSPSNNKDQLQPKLVYLNQALPQLRQLLSCVVCCRLLSDPYVPREAQCQHNVCRLCIRGKKVLNPACAECADCTDFNAYNENKQMHCLMLCYKGLCQYVLHSALYHELGKEKYEDTLSGVPLPSMSAEDIVLEGANYDDATELCSKKNNVFFPSGKTASNKNYVSKNKWIPTRSSFCKVSTPEIKQENSVALCEILKSEPTEQMEEKKESEVKSQINNNLYQIAEVEPKMTITGMPTPLTIASAQLVSLKRQALKTENAKPVSYKLAMSELVNSQANYQPAAIKALSNGAAMYSVLYTGIGNKITIKRKSTNEDMDKLQKKNTETLINNTNMARQVISEEVKTTNADNSMEVSKSACNDNNASKRRGCRCGNATPTPGKLTCCGQRCPCYVEAKSCTNCKCRGCRNPHRPGGGKIRPIIPKLSCYEIQINNNGEKISTTPVSSFGNTTTNHHQIYANYSGAIPIEYFEYNCKFPTNEIVIPVESKTLATTTQTNLPIYTTQTHEFNSQLQNKLLDKDGFYNEWKSTGNFKANISNMIAQNSQHSQIDCQKQILPVHEFDTNSTQKLSLYLQQHLNKQNIIMHPISSTATTTTNSMSDASTTSINVSSPLIMTSQSNYIKELVNLKSNAASNQSSAFTTTDNMLVTMLAKNSGINLIMGSSDI